MELSDRPRILICRMSAIGDTILTLPLLCAIRDRFPGAHISWVVEKRAAPVVAGHQDLDQLIVLERLWFRSPSKLLDARRQLQDAGPKISIDPQSNFKTSLAAWLSGAKTRIGFGGRHAREFSSLLNNQRVRPAATHLVDRSLELLRPLGIDRPPVRFRLPIPGDAREAVGKFIRDAQLGGGYVVINPGAGWDSRLWPASRYAEVSKHLAGEFGMTSVVAWAGQRELAWAEQIVAGADGHALLAPRTDLMELAALMESAALYIGSDTGPMHMAVAVDTPVVCLHGTTCPAESGPYGPGHIAIQERYDGGSSRQRRKAGNEAMRLITVERVVEACAMILHRAHDSNSPSKVA